VSHRWPDAALALLAAVFAQAFGGCAPGAMDPAVHAGGTLRGSPVPLRADPTVREVRLVPESMHDAHPWGAEPGGGLRASVAGVRILLSGDAVLTAADRLPSAPSDVVAVPDRMGGGFLFVLGAQVWRSDTWLGRPWPLVRSPSAIGDVLVGLDRCYLLYPSGTLAAFDPASGASEDLGALPVSPRMGRLAALDAWRAVAVVDLRGAMVTLDAGASWRPLDVAGEPVDVTTGSGALVVRTVDPGRQTAWWEVERDGQALRLPAAPAAATPAPLPDASSDGRVAGALAPSPLVAAIEDGWPLADGTALVARDGALARVRLDDGTVVQSVADAFPLRPARCHPLSLATPRDAAAFGFACGEPHGKTALYRWDAARSGLTAMRQFDEPRQVLAFGNGALAVRGACAPDAADTAPSFAESDDADRAWCVMPANGAWSERHFRGDRVDRARLVVLGDGRVAMVRPPEDELATARLTLSDGVSVHHLPLRFPLQRDDVTKALLRGVWLDGFEERRPGVLGGWVDAAGAVVGVEITLDGDVRVGEYIRDAGAPVTSGRWAFGWTPSRRAFETTDGGMTWTKGVDVPEPIAPIGTTRERACGPVGCIAAGWLKVGWVGASETAAHVDPTAPLLARPSRPPPSLRFACERVPSDAAEPAAPAGGPRLGFGQPASVAPGAALPAFCGKPAPLRPSDSAAVVSEIVDGVAWPRRAGPVGMVYGWGPPSGDWDKLGRWEVRWRSPWAGCASASGPAPWPSVDAAARALGRTGGPSSPLTVVAGEDATHALLVSRRQGGFDVAALDVGRAPQDVHRADGDVFPDIEGALESGGRWYVASAQSASQRSATVVWEIEGDAAREVGRFPRAGPDGRASVHLARRTQGRSVGVVVEGKPDATRPGRVWVDAVDPDTGEVGEPAPLTPLDFGGHPPAVCTGDDEGWEVVLPYAGSVDLDLAPGVSSSVQSPLAAMRMSSSDACIERLAGFSQDDSPPVPAGSPTARLPAGRSFDVSLTSSGARTPFRCRLP
jgi:hypothetical protein